MQTVTEAKRGKTPTPSVPRAGTKTRDVYDLFMQNRGVPVKIGFTDRAYLREQLIDCYGLDIRMLKPGEWVLAGEWFGKNYIDYIAAVALQE